MITLNHHRISLTIAPEYGSNMTSFKIDQQELIHCDQALLKRHDFTGNFVLWPLPNRVRNRIYKFNNQKYSLESVAVPRGNYSLIHGLVRDATWQFQATDNKLTTWIEITPQFEYWHEFPWHSRLTLTYLLDQNGIKIEYQVENLDNRPMAFGFGLHPLFKQAVAIRVPAKYMMETDGDLLPTGKLLPAKLNNLTPVSQLDLDDVFTGLTDQQTIEFPRAKKLTINTSSDFTHCVVYTKEKAQFICVESQTCSTDAHNLTARGLDQLAHLITLEPGKIQRGWVKYEAE